jgi:hypothetical protein
MSQVPVQRDWPITCITNKTGHRYVLLVCLNACSFLLQPKKGSYNLVINIFLLMQDNNIEYWRNFVNEYFAPTAKKRWCVSLYGSGRQTTGVFPQVYFWCYWICTSFTRVFLYFIYASELYSVLSLRIWSTTLFRVYLFLSIFLSLTFHIRLQLQDVWHCEICNRKPGRGFGEHHLSFCIFLSSTCFYFYLMLLPLQRQRLRSYRDYAKSNMRVAHWKNYCI